MYLRRIIQTVSIFGVAAIMMAANASATAITFNTSATGTGGSGFNGANALSLTSSSGVAATLSFEISGVFVAMIPARVIAGKSKLLCPAAQFDTLVQWGRYGELFGFNADTGAVYLDVGQEHA